MPRSHDDRIRNAINGFEAATARIVRLLEGLNEEAAKRAAEDGGWTPAQVGVHVAMTNELFAGVFSGAVPMAQPAPAGFAENPNVFSSVPSKMADSKQ
ncbi:MAG TPA: DinB family protein [Vicinamibacterales bacterium]|nr:DinB family protein [Vicinamibacterales bacterium]